MEKKSQRLCAAPSGRRRKNIKNYVDSFSAERVKEYEEIILFLPYTKNNEHHPKKLNVHTMTDT